MLDSDGLSFSEFDFIFVSFVSLLFFEGLSESEELFGGVVLDETALLGRLSRLNRSAGGFQPQIDDFLIHFEATCLLVFFSSLRMALLSASRRVLPATLGGWTPIDRMVFLPRALALLKWAKYEEWS